ncbi:MAG: hypothetical protein LH630_08270, partial [Actinomycetia bacterium]|nr:hypothetical protein [Actinomycetes bacterium]
MSTTSMVTRSRLLTTVVSAALAAATLVALPAGTATAATCTLAPQLRDITVTQGVGSYSPLVRGKEALVRSYLSLPSCAARGSSIAVTGATLNVTTPGGTTPISPDNLVTSPAPFLAPFTSAPAVDSPADPRFVIPGSVLAPAANTARYTATMTVTVNYSSKASNTASPVAGSVRFTTRPGSTAPISSVVEKRTNALRVLVVPMGDPNVSYAQQFDAAAQSTTAGAMRVLARTLPVPDGVGDLASPGSAAGIRYAVAPTIADISTFKETIGGASKFCGKASNFDGIAAKLSTFLQVWNTNNPGVPADRVIGVVSDRLSFGGEAGCAEGMSKVGQPITWARLVPASTNTPSATGSTMAMEIAHTFGDVSLTAANADPFSRYHSKNTQADDSAPNRAYNVPTRQFLATDRTVMAVRDTWNDQTTLLEPADWAFTLCALTPAPLPTSCPTGTTSVGTAESVANAPTFVISGVIDRGPPTTVEVTESYFKNGVPQFKLDPASDYRLVQKDAGGGLLSNVGVAVNFETSDHDHDRSSPAPESGVVTAESTATFTAAVPFNTDTDTITLEKDGVVLYARDRVPAPEVTAVVPGDGPGSTERVSEWTVGEGFPDVQGYSTTSSSDISGDGSLVVFRTAAQLAPLDNNEHDDIYLRNVANKTTTLITIGQSEGPIDSDGASYDPVISADGSTVAFVSSAHNLISPQPTNDSDHVYVYDVESESVSIVDSYRDGAAEVSANMSAQDRPVLSADGRFVVFTSLATNLTPWLTEIEDFAARVYVYGPVGEGSGFELVSVPSSDCGEGATCVDRGESPGSITDAGHFVSFLSAAQITQDSPVGIRAGYVRDRQGGTTKMVTEGSALTCDLEGCTAIPNPIDGDLVSPPLLSPLS